MLLNLKRTKILNEAKLLKLANFDCDTCFYN